MLKKHFKNVALLALIGGLFAVFQPQIKAEHLPKYPINNNVQFDLTYNDLVQKQPKIAAVEGNPALEPNPTSKPIKMASATEYIKSAPTSTPTSTPTTTPEPKVLPEVSNAPHSVIDHIVTYSEAYGVTTDIMIEIARCESGFRENAVNGPYAGIFQFTSSTWQSNRRAMGEDPNPDLRFNAEEAAKTAAFKMNRDGYGAWPACSRKALSLLN